ncbi:MAG: hypothetical protein N4A63_17290 [Vallitalea sp.]|jgi:hypothetical protein|nr:hypothetical protein [Vallitalea sp.]
MNLDEMQVVILILSALFTLFQAVYRFIGRRVEIESSSMLNFIKMVIFIYVASEVLKVGLLPYKIYTILGIILIYIINNYFIGSTYKINTQRKELLIKSINNAVSSSLSISAVQEEKDDEIIFRINNTRSRIQLKEDVKVSGKSTYSIKFKEWKSRDLKRQILKQINDELDNFEDYKTNKIKIITQLALSLGLVLLTIGLLSNNIMRKHKIDFTKEKIPKELHFIEKDYNYTDKEVIEELHNYLIKTPNSKVNDINEKNFFQHCQLMFEYGAGGNIICMNEKGIHIFVKDIVVKDKSTIHWICWKIHKIYDKTDGTFYSIWMLDKEEYNKIKYLLTKNDLYNNMYNRHSSH